MRTVRTDRFRYTRNYKTDRIFLQPQYRDPKDYVQNLRELYAKGELSPKLTEIYFGERPAEEFYDVKSDPSQLNNLVGNARSMPKNSIGIANCSINGWPRETTVREKSPHEELAFQADDQKWGRAVNPEYEVVRQRHAMVTACRTLGRRSTDRDPQDGKLLFTFDCGGWQTEGWTGDEKLGNIAGRQGFLGFPTRRRQRCDHS